MCNEIKWRNVMCRKYFCFVPGSDISLLALRWVTLFIKKRLNDANVAICCVRVSSLHGIHLNSQFFVDLESLFCEESTSTMSATGVCKISRIILPVTLFVTLF